MKKSYEFQNRALGRVIKSLPVAKSHNLIFSFEEVTNFRPSGEKASKTHYGL
ncbi:MAG: hypothetical protein IPJ82_10185 [Lewinellaceae bacterium]|nr:hypothetical protein [Lewinellaceae bacterium]